MGRDLRSFFSFANGFLKSRVLWLQVQGILNNRNLFSKKSDP